MPDPSDTSQVIPSAPPTPQEVKVRTLKSDLASIAASGGGLPRYENVKIAKADQAKAGGGSGFMIVIVTILLLAIIVAIAVYFINQLVLKK